MLAAAGCAPVTLADKEVWQWQQQWRRAYAGTLHAETGAWTKDGFDWHVFSFGLCAHKRANAAWGAFRRVEAGPFLVLSAEIDVTFGFSCVGKPPEGLDLGIDLLVAPESMEWTMAFDHEAIGPFFAVYR